MGLKGIQGEYGIKQTDLPEVYVLLPPRVCSVQPDLYCGKKSLRHATAMADLYYFVASPVQLVENTHDRPTPSLRPGKPMSQCMSRPMSQCLLSQKLNLAQLLR